MWDNAKCNQTLLVEGIDIMWIYLEVIGIVDFGIF